MNLRAIRTVVRRDLTVLRGNKAVVIPMIGMPLMFVVVFPVSLGLIARLDLPANGLREMARSVPSWAFDSLPSAGGPQLASLLLAYMLPPLTLIIPLIFALVVATDAIAGERERGTLEGLLLAPMTDRELLIAKACSALVPALTIGIGGSVIYAVITDLMVWPYAGGPLLPNPTWLVLVLWLGPALVAAALGLAVLVSARAKSAQGAQQIAGVAVLPVVFLAVGQISGLLFLGPLLLVPAGLVLWGLAALFIRLGSRALVRDRLGVRLQ